MRGPLAASTSPWRAIAVAAALLVVASLAAFGVAPFATAQDRGDLPDSITIPHPRVGDRGTYTAQTVRSTADGVEILVEERPAYAFEWLPDRTILDRNGTELNVHAVRQTHLELRDEDRPGLTYYSFDDTLYLRVDSAEAVARTTVSRHRHDWEDESTYGDDRRTFYVDHPFTTVQFLCGVRTPLQGRTVDLEGTHRVLEPCGTTTEGDHPYYYDGYVADAVEQVDGWQAVRFYYDHQRDSTVWYAEGVPYPVRMTVERHSDEDVVDVYRLTEFEAGDAPIDVDLPLETGAAAPVEMGPRHVHGPDETGLDVPFLLSDAFRRARDNPTDLTLFQFMQDHPDAYIAEATWWGRGFDDDAGVVSRDRVWWHWSFIVTDGVDGVEVNAWKNADLKDVHDAAGLGPGDALFDETARYDFRYDAPRSFYTHPGPADAPSEMPTVASVLARWEHQDLPGYDLDEPNGWGFVIHAGDDPYGAPMRIWAGSRVAEVEHPAWEASWDSLLHVDVDGTTLRLEEEVTVHVPPGEPPDWAR